ncbi:MAG: response regulator [Verrucomicrobia bacterium]|nr:response regulator [Verrucomicrobiota bacterium]
MTVKETSQVLNIPIPTVYYHIKRGTISTIKIGGRWRIMRDRLNLEILKTTTGHHSDLKKTDVDENKISARRIGVVEDDPVYRAYMKGLLQRSLKAEVVDVWDSVEAMLADTRFLLVELLFVDLELPGMSGLELISRLSKLPDPPSCVVLTSSLNFNDIMSAIRGGASGYLVKTSDTQTFFESLRQVILDGVSLSPLIARVLIDEFRVLSAQSVGRYLHLETLTPRERQVLDNMARHGSAKGIGEALGLSHETVRAHTKKIYQKLHVKSKSEALAVLAQENQK